MSLNIKSSETHRLVKELAALAGTNMTAAITEAVREKLSNMRHQKNISLADKLMAIGKDCAAHLKEPFRSIDHGDWLYDERGLPK